MECQVVSVIIAVINYCVVFHFKLLYVRLIRIISIKSFDFKKYIIIQSNTTHDETLCKLFPRYLPNPYNKFQNTIIITCSFAFPYE